MEFRPPNAERFLCLGAPGILPGAPALLGVGYDGTTSFRPGARFGPDAIRSVADLGLETYSPEQDRDLAEVSFADLGNLDLPFGAPEPVVEAVREAVRELLEAGAIPFLLGGEHGITPGAVRAVWETHPELAVVQFDAHADLRDSFDGTPWSHACAMRRILDFLPPERMRQVGIRSGTREEFAELRTSGRLVAPEAASLAAALEAPGIKDRPLYLTIDLDLFDPAFLPGTGTPEPGGIGWRDFAGLLATLPGDRIVALDVVELSPKLDPTEVSSVIAAKVVRECLLRLGRVSSDS